MPTAVTNAAGLIGCGTQDLMIALSTRSIQAGKDKVAKRLTLQQVCILSDILHFFLDKHMEKQIFFSSVDMLAYFQKHDIKPLGQCTSELKVFSFH